MKINFIMVDVEKKNIIYLYYRIESLNGRDLIKQSGSNPTAVGRITSHYIRLPRATSSLTLSTSRDGASTASVGNYFVLFQFLISLQVKKKKKS